MIARGTVLRANGGIVQAALPGARVGDRVRVANTRAGVCGIVTSLGDERAFIAVSGDLDGIACGSRVEIDLTQTVVPGTPYLGRAMDAQTPLALPRAPLPHEREAIATPLWTGVAAIDGFLTVGRGARVGIFGPPGAGKSTLLRSILAHADADAVVLALIGERGREAHEWMQSIPAHATFVCATSDRSAAERIACAHTAMAQADALRSRGLHVLLILDSLARYAQALREVALAQGQPVGRGGFPAGVFARLAQYSEAAGNAGGGSVTAMVTVLSDGDERDPVSDCARSLLDGHIELCAARAREGRFPAIDILSSRSRTMSLVSAPAQVEQANAVRTALALLERTADGRSLGIAYEQPGLPQAVQAQEQIESFLSAVGVPSERTLSLLAALADTLK